MSLQHLKTLALEHPLELNWDTKNTSDELRRVEATLKEQLPDLEQLYLQLSTGQSTVHPDTPSALSYEDREQALDNTAESLVDIYSMLDGINRYNLIMELIKPH
jgi:hypothetical protein